MRALTDNEMNQVGGGWFCWGKTSYRSCKTTTSYCAPKPTCEPKPVCEPKPACTPKPVCEPKPTCNPKPVCPPVEVPL